ncbi:HNH endonuclease [Burkholderia sp. MSMB1835]|uniref:HNH endonuclease n=1 Tax=Burkholderia sp. MSMB1835 TaxID=1637876 RepID=UPI000754EA2A|nr:HNH endonuclease [Burkholderia sp. MSMB1835]KVL39777.1 hypothetical protein WS96_05270 [Burkholderia sp. MSMB1835]
MTTTKTHETRRTLAEDVFYPDQESRTESATFRASKRAMKAAGGYVCAVCGDDPAVESHHRFFEWAFSHAIDWNWIRGVALNHVDSTYNQLLLCALHHRGKDHGRHEESDPVWSVQAFLLPGFVYSPDELKQMHAKEPK